MKVPRSPLPSLLLLLAFLVGGFGLPLADAIIFHSHPGASPVAERILTAGPQARSHVQVCSLEQTPATKFAALAVAVGLERLPVTTPPVRCLEPGLAHAPERPTPLLPRAPPSA